MYRPHAIDAVKGDGWLSAGAGKIVHSVDEKDGGMFVEFNPRFAGYRTSGNAFPLAVPVVASVRRVGR